MAAVGLSLTGGAGAASPQPHTYTTARADDGVPGTVPAARFGCSDRIYAVLEIADLASGRHALEFHWRDPRGKVSERTRFAVHAARPTERYWAWLRFRPPTGASMFRVFDPSIGMSEFIGQWSVEYYLDGKRLSSDTFNVLC